MSGVREHRVEGWVVTIAGEPVEIPDIFPGVEDPYIKLKPDEFGALVRSSADMAGSHVRFWDRQSCAAMCGHATIGLAYLRACMLDRPEPLVIEVGSERLEIQAELGLGGTVHACIDMPRSFRVGTASSSRMTLYSCGNTFVFVERKVLSEGLKTLLHEAHEHLLSHNSYGVVFFEVLSRDNAHTATRSVTFFGKEVQQDLSPCGTGSVALATMLSESGHLAVGARLLNTSLAGDTFMVHQVFSPSGNKNQLSYVGKASMCVGTIAIETEIPLEKSMIESIPRLSDAFFHRNCG